MHPDERRLARHLGFALAAKIVALAVFWWLFFSGPQDPAHDVSAYATAQIATSPRGVTP